MENMPPKIAAAIVEVMKAVPKLGKGETNKHGDYKFASIDDFLEAVRPLCAAQGLIIVQDEDTCEINDGWVVIKYRFTLAHSSGEVWDHRPARTIMVSAKMGAQAFGAAQSYALKQFERALFQIATGDKEDVDHNAPEKLPPMKRAEATKPPAEPATISVPGGEDVNANWKSWCETFIAAIRNANTLGEVAKWIEANDAALKGLGDFNEKTHKYVIGQIDNRRGTLAQAPSEDAA